MSTSLRRETRVDKIPGPTLKQVGLLAHHDIWLASQWPFRNVAFLPELRCDRNSILRLVSLSNVYLMFFLNGVK